MIDNKGNGMKASGFTKETILDFGIKDRKFPEFKVGDTIQVAQKIKEGNKQRIQMFKGDVLDFHNKGISTTFTVRRLSADGIFVEKIFPYYSPNIDNVQIVKKGDVCRAKLFYLRDKIGRAARIKEKILTKEQKLAGTNKSTKEKATAEEPTIEKKESSTT